MVYFMTHRENKRKIIEGVVVSNKAQKTLKIVNEKLVKHPKYGKVVKKRLKIAAHNNFGDVKIGTVVRAMECRPISKTKKFVVIEVVQ